MNKFSRIRHHIDMKDVKERHLEEFIEKKKEEKRIAEEREAINAEYQRWKFDWRNDIKGFDHFGEGMTTQMLTGVLPSAGNADLTNLQLGLTGEGDIDYGEGGLGDEAMAGEGQYTCFSNLDILDNVDEPNNTGTRLRIFDQDSKEFRNQGHGGGEHGFLLAIPGYQRGMLRNVKPSGDYNGYDKSYRQNKGLPLTQNGSDLYYHIYGATKDELGQGPGSWNSNDGVTDNGWGTVLHFNGPGSPRYVALKAIDSTEFDTIKIHAAVASNSMVSDYRDSDGVLRDKKVQVYYWAGDHKDYVRHPSASGIYDGNKTASQDGWRPINMKPNGELDDTVDPYIIKHKADRDTHGVDANGVTYSAAGKLHPYSLPLPEYTRSKNARYIIIQTDKNNFSDDNAFTLASVRFQRKNTLRVPSISKPLTDIEAAPFVRVGQGVDQNAKQRKKRVRDMINASIKYGNMKFGKGMFNSTNLDDDLEEEKKLKEEKICSRIAKKKKSNWRKDLAESDWSPVTSTIANRATQTFQHDSGGTSTFAGLGGVEVHPDQVTLDLGFGETIDVSPPTYSDLALAGYAKPLGGILKKQNSVKEKEINSRLDSSEKFAKKVKADKFMKARVEDQKKPPEYLKPSDQEKADEVNKRLKEVAKYKTEMKVYDKQLKQWTQDRDSKYSDRVSKIDSYLKSLKQKKLIGNVKISDLKWAPIQGQNYQQSYTLSKGKLVVIRSHNAISWDDGKKIDIQVFEPEHGKRISIVRRGEFTKFYNASPTPIISGKEFGVTIPPEPQGPTPPAYMKGNMDKGWQPVTQEDEDFINKMNTWFNTIPTGGINLAAKLALNLAKGDISPVTESPGSAFTKIVNTSIADALKRGWTKSDKIGGNSYWNSGKGEGAIRYDVLNGKGLLSKAGYAPVTASLGQFSIQRTDKGIRVADQYDISGGFTSPGGAAYFDSITKLVGGKDVQATGEKLTAIAMRRGAEVGFNMVDTDTGEELKPIYSGEEEYNSRTAGRFVKGKDGKKVWQSDPNAPVIATPKGFHIPIDFTIPWNQIPPETAKLLQIGQKKTNTTNKVKSLAKKGNNRSGLSLDEPIVRKKKVSKDT